MEVIKLKETLPFIKSCLTFLDRKEKIKAVLIAYLLLFSSLLEMLALVAIMPFVSLIIDPNVITGKDYFKIIENVIGKYEIDNLIIIFALISISLLIISLFSSFFIQHYVRIFVVKCQNRLAAKIVHECISAPYLWFLEQNSVSKPHYLQTDILMWANDGLLRIMQMIGSITLLIIASLTLLYISFSTGIIGIIVLVFLSLIVLNITRPYISNMSELRRTSNTSSLSALSQIFRGIKDIRLNNSENYFKDKFLHFFSLYGYSGYKLRLFQNISPVIIMALGQSCLIIISLFLWFSNYSGAEIASIMAFIIIIVSRLVPNINKLISDLNGIWAALPHVESLQNHKKFFLKLKNKNFPKYSNKKQFQTWSLIKLQKVSFKYPNSKNLVLKEINLNFNCGRSYAIVGKSGSGKTTLIDIILGILKPTKGEILIDNLKLNNRLKKQWMSFIGYVPQQPFIADDTIKNNIAFGMPENQINIDLVKKCLFIAQLDDLIKSSPKGIDTEIGEFGTKISGGQKQRIAIARALYNKPQILILDEATSAVDGINEKLLQHSLYKLGGFITTITIAHKMSTIEKCDNIILLDDGEIVSQGNFSNLRKKSLLFRELISTSYK